MPRTWMGQLFSCMLFMMVLSLAAPYSQAATVIVDPGPGGDYDTLTAAIAALPTWAADANSDVIELVAGLHTIGVQTDIPDTAPTGALTIRPSAGAHPVVQCGATVGNALRAILGGTVLIQGLSIIGEAGIANNANTVRFILFRASNGVPLNFTVEDCIFTANDGSNQPRTDWDNTPFEDGGMRGAIAVSTSNAVITGTIRNCVLTGGASGHDGPINITGDQVDGSSFLVENVLSLRYIPLGMQIRNSTGKVALTFRGCAILEPRDEVFKWVGSGNPAGPDLLFEDCILQSANAGESIIRLSVPLTGGDLTVRRCTSVALTENANRHIAFQDIHLGKPDAVTITDSVFYLSDELIACFPAPNEDPPGPDPPFGSFSFNNCALIGPGPRSGQSAQINDAFAALYGGSGPLTDDPMFPALSINDIPGQFNGTRKWDSSTNSLFDVGSAAYCAKASDGSNLNGGADTVNGICPSPVEFWMQY